MNGWPRVLCWGTYLFPASRQARTFVTVAGRWTLTLTRPTRRP